MTLTLIHATDCTVQLSAVEQMTHDPALTRRKTATTVLLADREPIPR